MRRGVVLGVVLAGLLAAATTASAGWRLTGLTYHGYCPPAAIKSGLCRTGADFDASAYITAPADLGEYVVNQMVPTEAGLSAGSRVRVPYPVRDRIRWHEYALVDLWRDVVACDLMPGLPLEAVTLTGRAVTLLPERDGCALAVRTDWTEPQDYPRTVTRDATLTFTDTDCR